MKIIGTALLILFIHSSLGAYTKQIVLDSFKDKESAQAALESLKSDAMYEKLSLVAKENGFTIHVDASKLVAEPLKNQFILEETLKMVSPKFCKATVKDLEVTTKKVEAPLEKSEVVAPPSPQSHGPMKKIILGTFSTQKAADEELAKFQKNGIYEQVESLAKENGFVIEIRPLGNYTILVIEPLAQEMHTKVKDLVKPLYKEAYSRDSVKVPSIQKVEVTPPSVTKTVEANQSKAVVTPPIAVKASDKNISAMPKMDVNATKLPLKATDVNTTKTALKTDVNTTKTVAKIDMNITKTPDVNTTKTTVPVTVKPNFVVETMSPKDQNVTEAFVADTNATEANTTDANTTDSNTTQTTLTQQVALSFQEQMKMAQDMKAAQEIEMKKAKAEMPQEESSYALYVWLLILAAVAGTVLYYYPRFKKIYDQY